MRVMDQGSPVVAVDETGFFSTEAPSHGYGKLGHRLKPVKIQKHRIRLSCAMAIDTMGRVYHRFENGAFNGRRFQSFIQQLEQYPKGSVIVMDNIGFHKSKSVQHLVNRRGLKIMFTPPYSPECNPSERFFSIIKLHFRNSLLHPFGSSVEDFRGMVHLAIKRARDTCSIPSLFSLSEVSSS